MKPYVNLVPTDIRRQVNSIKMLRRWYLLTIALVAFGIVLACPSQASRQVLMQEIYEATPAANRSQHVAKQLDKLSQQINRMHGARFQHLAMTGQYPPLAVFSVVSEFCSRHPDSIQITSIEYTNDRFPKREDLPPDILKQVEETADPTAAAPAQPPATASGTVVVRAKLTDPALATTLLAALKSSKLFKEVTLMNHNVDREEGSYTSSIDLTCKF